MTSVSKAGTTEKIFGEKIFAGIGAVNIHVAFQTILVRPDPSVSGLMLGHKMTV
jgi:hypothetical protein